MTFTIELWMLIPAVMIIVAIGLIILGEQESGMLGGLFHGLAAFALFFMAGAFLLGRWLA